MALRQLVRVQKELRSLLTVRTPCQIGRVFPVWQLHLRCLCLQREVKNYADSGKPKGGLIWEGYKRNFKGSIPPKKTRLRCKRGTKVCGNPCPICRNDIQISYQDKKLLEQFVSPHTGHILEASKTGLCRQQQKKLVAAVEKAWDHGVLPCPIPRKLPEQVFRIPPWNKMDVR